MPSCEVARTGCEWRYLPARFPDWQAVWSQWRRWRDKGTWAQAMRVLEKEIRLRCKRKADPTMVMIDAQTVQGGRAGPTFHEAGGRGGYTRGAKRTILIETLGLAVAVESAKPHDVQSARAFLKEQLDPKHSALPGLQAIVAERGYTGLLALTKSHGLNLDIKKAADAFAASAVKARRQASEGQARLHAAPPALQGRERLRPARDVAAALALLRADGARRADLARGGVRRLPLRAAPGRADLINPVQRRLPSEPVSTRRRTSTSRCATSGRRARVPGSRWEAGHAATGTRGDQRPRARPREPPRVRP
jgi:Putative transposase of IS4/5 family (DUF4096)/Transposase DDE domain